MANGLLNGLLAYWAMETLPQLTIPDLSGKGNDLGALAGTTWTNVTGINVLALDQGSSVGNLAGIASPHPFAVTGSFTINFWVNRNSGEWSDTFTDTFHGVWDDGTQKNWYTVWNPGINVFQIGLSTDGSTEAAAAQSEVSGGGDPAADTWHMVTCGYDQAAGGPFVQVNAGTRNNVLGQALSADIFGASTASFGVAQFVFSGQRVCAGAHDEIAFWGRALTTDDVNALHASGAGLFFAGFDGEADNCSYKYYWKGRRSAS